MKPLVWEVKCLQEVKTVHLLWFYYQFPWPGWLRPFTDKFFQSVQVKCKEEWKLNSCVRLKSTDLTDEVGSVICLWTLSLARVWRWFFSDLACTSREISGDVWLIFRPDFKTGTAKGGHDASFIQSSSLSSLSSPSTCKGINCITRCIVQMWNICPFLLNYDAES